jgi:hypothetical protein
MRESPEGFVAAGGKSGGPSKEYREEHREPVRDDFMKRKIPIASFGLATAEFGRLTRMDGRLSRSGVY